MQWRCFDLPTDNFLIFIQHNQPLPLFSAHFTSTAKIASLTYMYLDFFFVVACIDLVSCLEDMTTCRSFDIQKKTSVLFLQQAHIFIFIFVLMFSVFLFLTRRKLIFFKLFMLIFSTSTAAITGGRVPLQL